MSILQTKGNVEDVFKVLDNHNINSAFILDNKLKALNIIKEKPQAELSLIQLGKIKTYEEYLDYTDKWELDLYGDMVYTEEEFNFIKEMSK